MPKKIVRKNRFYDTRRFGVPQIRVYHKAGSGKKSPRYLMKCGCCDNSFEVFYGGDTLEINGVHGSVRDWRELLAPLLGLRTGRIKAQRS